MKNNRLPLLFVLCVITLIIPIIASAHSGGTDSNGGHYNHSTGEYHYHHGYGPHDHYDMDGDGDIDCPYNFSNPSSNIRSELSTSGEWLTEDEIDELIYSAYAEGQAEGYNSGYEAGYETGCEDGYEDASYTLHREYEDRLKEELKSQRETHYLIFGLILASLIILITISICNSNSSSHIKSLKNSSVTNELAKYQTEMTKLKKSLNDHTEATYVLNIIANKAGVSSVDLARSLFVNFRKASGLSEDAARSEFEEEMKQFKRNLK